MTMLSARAIGPPPWVGPATIAAGASAGRATGTEPEPAVSIPSRMACSMDAAGSEEGPTSGLGKEGRARYSAQTMKEGREIPKRDRKGGGQRTPPMKTLRDATHRKRPA